ncbi:hypothetical protein AMATHDRAFT_3040 [Amanita thiersii Skay4041]|uniref:Pre-rRNA-processing protein RIX1 N-terminal domain-containing protein n=1 Tax=Amanita thiersii Skay4041 TaxID=703135 RepID=A0A2A9NPY8_9AGAR|nr:hypothetical protein AMATHDRAFT_3040 [Amanita thiersii Skay4041]
MDSAAHPLKLLLQLQLATDSLAASQLPYVISSLNYDCFLPSPHIVKWTTRLHSLLHSKDPGGRWAGLCLTYQTSQYSKTIMVDYAQGWLSVALPLLSKNEPIPVLKAAVRLLCTVFNSAMDVAEFQRQVSIPNVPKMTIAVVALIEKHANLRFRVFLLTALSHIVSLYPSLHKTSYNALSSLSLRYLNGDPRCPTSTDLLDAASRLYATLHTTGGKIGGAALWRKSVEETISFGWNAFFALRTTFPVEARLSGTAQHGSTGVDPSVSVPLNLDRLRCCAVVLRELLSATTHRPVQLPLGALVKLTLALLTCSNEAQIEGHVDPNVRIMEVMATPALWELGCDLLTTLATCAHRHLTPNIVRLVSCLVVLLEQQPNPSLQLAYLRTLRTLLIHCYPVGSDFTINRLTKAVLSILAIILPKAPEVPKAKNSANAGKKGKKRVRNFEGEEVLNGKKDTICKTYEEGQILLIALEVLPYILRNPSLSAPLQSMSIRVLVAVYLFLPRLTRASLSPDPAFYDHLFRSVRHIIADIGTGTSSALSTCLGLIISTPGSGANDFQRHLELLLHPRVPPLIRSLLQVQSLTLLQSEESEEEANIRNALGLRNHEESSQLIREDMEVDSTNAKQRESSQQSSSILETAISNPPQFAYATQIIPEPRAQAMSIQTFVGRTSAQAQGNNTIETSETERPISRNERYIAPLPKQVQEIDDEEMPSIDMESDTDDSDS